jgi:DNA modification methylase
MSKDNATKHIPWLPTEKSCSCPDHAMNCLSQRAWLRNQVPIWWFNKSELNTKYDLISRSHHPAIFPTALAKRMLDNYTHAGETVLDVFSGMGTTLYAARITGRHGVGLELSQTFADLTAKRLNLRKDRYCSEENMTHKVNRKGLHLHQICSESNQLLNYLPERSIDLVFTSPPYWDLLKQSPSRRNLGNNKYLKNNYSSNNSDLSNSSTLNEFLTHTKKIFRQVYQVLKPGKRLVLNTADYRRKGKFISLSNLYINALTDLGFEQRNVIIWDRRTEYEIGIFSYPKNFIVNNGMFEYLLEFKK